jgi:protocatechuate 3,4-dioxygenase beta subunit
MKSRISKFWALLFILVINISLAACASQAPAPTVTTTLQEVIERPTSTDIPPTETLPPVPTATLSEPIQKPTEPASTTSPTTTSTPEPTLIACDGVLTSPQQEGPFYSPGSPERSSLIEERMPGVPVLIFGRVFDQDCDPIPGAKLDFWLADVNGEYDNVGYTLRGHVFTDENGYYTLESIEPTAYTGRPPHIHVKVFAPGGEELLTTQMYFAGSEGSTEVTNSPKLYVKYLATDESGRQQILFNFVVEE